MENNNCVREDQPRTFLTFSLRMDAIDDIEQLKLRLEFALDCKLNSGVIYGVPSFVGENLGIKISLGLWRGLGGKHVYQLHGGPAREIVASTEWDTITINEAIIDLLMCKGAGEWRVPSSEERIAEGNYNLRDI